MSTKQVLVAERRLLCGLRSRLGTLGTLGTFGTFGTFGTLGGCLLYTSPSPRD